MVAATIIQPVEPGDQRCLDETVHRTAARFLVSQGSMSVQRAAADELGRQAK